MNEEIRLFESEGIQWRRDWDAVAIGLVLGILGTLAAQALW